MPVRILVVDDDANVRSSLEKLLRLEGYEVTSASSTEEALECCRQSTFHLALTDLQLPGRNGISLISALREACPETKTVLITGHGSVRSAVTALKRGAVEYITKPIKIGRLLTLIRALLGEAPHFLSNRLLGPSCHEVVTYHGLITRSPLMRAVFDQIEKAAASTRPVLFFGESGAGKQRAARALHAAWVRLTNEPVDHSLALPFTRLRPEDEESLEAARGVFFIDDVALAAPSAQANLIRLVDSLSGRSDPVRLLISSSHDLDELVAKGLLRSDLRQRLSGFRIDLPRLGERAEDVPLLASEFVREVTAHHQKAAMSIPTETQRLLQRYNWPGNVAELRNVIEQAVLLANGRELEPRLLPHLLHRASLTPETIQITVGTALGEVEREVILRTLAANEGNKTATAEVLGISRRSIYNKLAVYGIARDETEASDAPLSSANTASG